MPEYLENACEEIDAAMFSGDDFLNEDNRKALKEYIGRWSRELERLEKEE